MWVYKGKQTSIKAIIKMLICYGKTFNFFSTSFRNIVTKCVVLESRGGEGGATTTCLAITTVKFSGANPLPLPSGGRNPVKYDIYK